MKTNKMMKPKVVMLLSKKVDTLGNQNNLEVQKENQNLINLRIEDHDREESASMGD